MGALCSGQKLAFMSGSVTLPSERAKEFNKKTYDDARR